MAQGKKWQGDQNAVKTISRLGCIKGSHLFIFMTSMSFMSVSLLGWRRNMAAVLTKPTVGI